MSSSVFPFCIFLVSCIKSLSIWFSYKVIGKKRHLLNINFRTSIKIPHHFWRSGCQIFVNFSKGTKMIIFLYIWTKSQRFSNTIFYIKTCNIDKTIWNNTPEAKINIIYPPKSIVSNLPFKLQDIKPVQNQPQILFLCKLAICPSG